MIGGLGAARAMMARPTRWSKVGSDYLLTILTAPCGSQPFSLSERTRIRRGVNRSAGWRTLQPDPAAVGQPSIWREYSRSPQPRPARDRQRHGFCPLGRVRILAWAFHRGPRLIGAPAMKSAPELGR